jgi:hypothetical protein
MLSGSFPIFALSNHTTFSQTQTGATVPLKSCVQLLVHLTTNSFRKVRNPFMTELAAFNIIFNQSLLSWKIQADFSNRQIRNRLDRTAKEKFNKF